jgi:nucleoside-diphosphate-sugar epimerase
MPDAVVIGGAGFIGKRITQKLVEAGYRVRVVSRSSSRVSTDPRIEYHAGDVSDAARMREVIAGSSLVYDLSMGGGRTWADYEREVIGGAMNVANACLEHGVQRLVYTSSIAALFLGAAGSADESLPAETTEDRGMYGRGKGWAERRLLELHAQKRLPVVIFRPGIVLGPGGALVHGAFGDQPSETCVLGWGPGTYPLPCVLVDDVAQALLLAKDAPNVEGQVFNLVGDVRPTAAEYIRKIAETTKRNFRFYPRSLFRAHFGDWFRHQLKKIIRGSAVMDLPYRDLQSLTMQTQLDCGRAKKLLGWKPEANPDRFWSTALGVHVRPLPTGDLRLETR